MGNQRTHLIISGILLTLSASYLFFYHYILPDRIVRMGTNLMPILAFIANPLFYSSLGAFIAALFIKYTTISISSSIRFIAILLSTLIIVGYVVILLCAIQAVSKIPFYPYLTILILHPQWFLFPGILLSVGIQQTKRNGV